jgi:hypothetical protein
MRTWLEELAGRPVPPLPRAADFEPTALPAEAIAVARVVWARRVTNETGSCEVARRLVATARALLLDAPVIAALARLEEDEVRHADLAREMLAVLGRADFVAEDVLAPLPEESAERSFVRQVVAALAVAETVSASRYAAVREATDLPIPRAFIDLFLRDEVLHGRLGFALLPLALERLAAREGQEAARAFATNVLRESLGALDRTVGQDAERRGMPEARPQPTSNPGVVEPAIDTLAFYDAVERTILPSFAAAGIDARVAWASRHEP